MRKFLVVDDEAGNRDLIREILDDKAACDAVGSGREAIEAFRFSLKIKNPYDLILLDIAMPEIDGLEVLRRIRDTEKENGTPPEKGIPIIMVTAFKEPFFESFKNGCDGYVLKPVDPDALIVKIDELLESRKTD